MVENILLKKRGADALLLRRGDGLREFVVAHNYNEETNSWSHGSYHSDLVPAVIDLEHAKRLTSIDIPDEYLSALVTPEIVESETGLRGDDAAVVAANACTNLSASTYLQELVFDQIEAENRTFMETAALERNVLFDRDRHLALADDADWRQEIEEWLEIDPGTLGDDEASRWAHQGMLDDLEQATHEVSEMFLDAVRRAHPEWRGSCELMARGTIERWDSTAQGHNYYSADPKSGKTAFEALVGDTDGIFVDCEIDRIWTAPDGTVNVRGVHHDGAVEVSVRAVPPGTEEREGELLEWNGFPKDEIAYAAFIEETWDGAVKAGVADCADGAIEPGTTGLDDLEAACGCPEPSSAAPSVQASRER